MSKVIIHDKTFQISIPSNIIQKRIIELAKQISEDLKDQHPVFIVALKGAFYFAADLMKNIPFECEVSFVRFSSYNGTQNEDVKIHLGINDDIKGKNVVLIEDMVDTGNTAIKLIDEIMKHEPKSIRLATLLFKPEKLKKPLKMDYIGFEVREQFIVGYGLDYDGRKESKGYISALLSFQMSDTLF